MKYKVLNVALIITSVFGYMEWGKDSSTFLLFAEADLLKKMFSDPASVIHPFTVIPLLGQVVLFITLFQKKPGKALTFTGIGCLSLLLLLILFIGIIGFNLKMIVSTMPFFTTSVYAIISYRRDKQVG